MKPQKIYNLLILMTGILTVVFLCSALMQIRTTGDVAQKLIPDALGDVISELSDSDTGGDFLTSLLLGDVGDVAKELGDQLDEFTGDIFIVYRVGILVPTVLAVIAMVLVWILKKKWKYLLSAGLSFLGAAVLLITELLVIPWQIYSNIRDIKILDWINIELSMWDISKMIADVLGAAFWASFVMLLILAVICIGGIFIKEKKQQQKFSQPSQTAPDGRVDREDCIYPETIAEPVPWGICGIAGKYAGGRIPIGYGDRLLIGSDASVCNLVLEGSEVQPMHCSVSFDSNIKQYIVRSYVAQSTYTDQNQCLSAGRDIPLNRGSLLIIGSDENIFRLV